jgi:hypothetical protein
VLGPPAVYSFLTLAARRFDERVAPEIGKFNWHRFLVSSFLSGLPSGLFHLSDDVLPVILRKAFEIAGVSTER